MSVNGTTIVEPVSITDVRTVLGESAYDLASLCRSSRINKWARYKPVISSRTDITSRALYEQMASAVTVNWGFDKTGFISGTSISALVEQAIAGDADWHYDRPTSGVCRLGDFAGYNHAALPPCSLSLPTGTVLAGSGIPLSLSAAAKDGGLGLEDFKASIGGSTAWSSMQWAIALVQYRGTTSEKITMTLLGAVTANVNRSFVLSATGTFDIVVMITNATTPNQTGGAYYYMLIPGGYTSLKVITSWVDFAVSAFKKVYNSTNTTITQLQLTFQATNHTDETVVIGIFILAKPKGAGVDIPSLKPDKSYSLLASQTISNTVTKSVSISVTSVNNYEVACGYLLNGEAHWYKVTGGGEVSQSEAWTVLSLLPSSGSGVSPSPNK